jgi:2,3-dihydroxybenzoate-AMP ligase
MLEGCTSFPPEIAERYIREGFWCRETIADAIFGAAQQWPDSIAAIDPVRTVTYSQLLAEARQFAAQLRGSGMARGDRIVIQLPNCIEFASLTLACFAIGAIPVMALPAFRRAELEYLLSFSDAKAIAIAPRYRDFDYASLVRELKAALPNVQSIFSTAPADGCVALGGGESPTPAAFETDCLGDPFEVALFLLSGGTTGLPKLIPRTSADYLYNAREATRICGLTSESRLLIALPAEHNFPLSCPGLLGALLTGATAIFSQSTNATDLAETIRRERVTYLPCVPALAISLLALPESDLRGLDSLEVITIGGQRLQEPTARALKRALPNVVVQQVLGMAEGLLCYTRLEDSAEIAATTQGRPLSPGDEIRIVNADGIDVIGGEIGELWCRGPYTIRGYYRAAERNRETFTADGFYRTGDLVRMHPSGNLVVEGRIKDLINRGGEKINAEEIEAHLLAHRAVALAAVVAMPDAVLGERACAYVVLRDGAAFDLATMREFLAERGVARFKWPERIEISSALPLTNVGKIKKTDLRIDIEQKLARERSAA